MTIAEDFRQLLAKRTKPTIKILTLDIETSPNLAYVWSLWRENIPLDRLIESGEIMCFAAKWYDNDNIMFYSTYHDGEDVMIDKFWELLDEADVVITYNGKRFDIPHANRKFLLKGLPPPSPYNHIDLYQTIKSVFKFVSNKLDNAVQELGIGEKTKHRGFSLWDMCLRGNDKEQAEAWEEMKTYCMQDVGLTDKLYTKVLPWIKNHPTVIPDVTGDLRCPRCGSEDISATDVALTPTMRYDAYVCSSCGGWSKARTGTRISELRSI